MLLLLSGLLPAWIGQAEIFADPAFNQVWMRSDQAVEDGKATRTWLWGPRPFSLRQEAYAESPGNQRLVEYFDKSRMEITNPAGDRNSRWFVTNGLLTIELVTGRVQLGDNSFDTRLPSEVPVGGDPGNAGPTYATFTKLISLNGSNRAEQKSGTVGESVDRAGTIGQASADNAKLIHYAYYDQNLGHNIPDVFWNWMQKLDEQWVFAMGLPIAEPYWARFTVGGTERDLLVQLFERRVLTYNPANTPQWQVEMGNIGQHYFSWRYDTPPTMTPAAAPAPVLPSMTPVTNPPTGIGGSITPSVTSGVTPRVTSTSGSVTSTVTPLSTITPSVAPTDTIAPIVTTTVTATVSPTPTPVVANAEETKLIEAINQYRVQNNLPALRLDSRLVQETRWHSEDMARNNYFRHIDSLGRDYPQRLGDFNYWDTPQNETILANYLAPAIFDLWKNDPAGKVLLDSRFNVFGVGYAYQATSGYKHYWSICLGAS